MSSPTIYSRFLFQKRIQLINSIISFMKYRGINLRRIIRAPNTQVSDPIQNANDDTSNPFNQFFSMFKTFLEENVTSNRQNHANPDRYYEVQARDREVVIEIPQHNAEGKIEMSELKLWTTDVVKATFSSAFNSYSKGDMSFEQAKIYCSQNVFKNIVRLSQSYHLSETQLETIDNHIKNGVIPYLAAKYPLTESSSANKKLQAAVHQVDSIESLSNNYFTNSPIIFQLRDNGNYNDLIMEMINDLIGKLQQSHDQNNFQDFQKFMSEIFQKVQDDDWVKKNHQHSGIRSAVSVLLDENSVPTQQMNMQQLKKRQDEKQKYRNQVKQYTNYLIGRKIPQDTALYSESDIKSGNIQIKSPQILRILTKWCEQLQQKYSNNYFSNRSQSVKLLKRDQVNSLLPWMRQSLDNYLEKQKQLINASIKQLFQNNYQMQASILQYEMNKKGDEHLDSIQKMSGKFSYKIVKNFHQYIITHLNRLIHGILKVSKRFHNDIVDSIFPSPPCLLSFKVGDLMRCKCYSKQKQILLIYQEIQRISRQNPEKLKIVRIKNRLRSGTNDILMNIRFNDSVLCQIQLAIDSRTSSFIKCSNMFHHYLYQLQRSLFGPLTELGSIWKSLDKRTSIYKQLVDQEQKEVRERVLHKCVEGQTAQLVPYKKSFICSSCKRINYHNRFLKEHLKCQTCGFLICAQCRIEDESLQPSSYLSQNSKKLIEICGRKIGKSERMPSFGICLFIKSTKLQLVPFNVVNFKNVDYLIKEESGQFSQIANFKTSADKQQFRNNYLVFEMKANLQYKAIDYRKVIVKYIVPLIIKQTFKKQKQNVSLMDLKLTTEQCKQILISDSQEPKTSIKSAFLTDNSISSLPFNSEMFPNLEWITLSRNELKNMEGISKFKNLKKLLLARCGITKFPDEIYQCVSLQDLWVDANYLQIDDKISNLINLKTFFLNGCQLQRLPQKIFECKSLINLGLNRNRFTQISKNIGLLQNLQVLSLNQNRITSLPEELGKLAKLRQLYLQGNSNLQHVLSLSGLVNLQVLNIANTCISQIIPPQQGFLKLQTLHIQSTKMTKLHPLFSKSTILRNTNFSILNEFQIDEKILINIEILSIIKNKSLNRKEILSKITRLKDISFSLNENNSNSIDVINQHYLQRMQIALSQSIESFPQISKFINLKVIKCSQSKFNKLADDVFQCLINLEKLQFDHVNITFFPKSLLSLKKLTTLQANNNYLTSFFDPNIESSPQLKQASLPNLTKVYLDNNKFTAFPLFLCNCPALEIVRIQENQVISIPPQISKMKKLRELALYSNRIQKIPIEILEIPELNDFNIAANRIIIIPSFMQEISKLIKFKASNPYLKTIECLDWVINSTHIDFGILKDKAITFRKKEIEEKEKERLRQDEEEKKKKQQQKALQLTTKIGQEKKNQSGDPPHQQYAQEKKTQQL